VQPGQTQTTVGDLGGGSAGPPRSPATSAAPAGLEQLPVVAATAAAPVAPIFLTAGTMTMQQCPMRSRCRKDLLMRMMRN
jgi:hypothetical protein